MERERATWTDERLGDLARSVERGFERTDEDLRALSVRLDARIDGVDRRLDALQRTLVQFGGAILVATLATLVSVLAAGA